MAASRYPLVLTDQERAMLEGHVAPGPHYRSTRGSRSEGFTPTAFAARRFYLLITWKMLSSSNGGEGSWDCEGRTACRHGCLICLEHTRRIRAVRLFSSSEEPSSTPKSKLLKANVEFTTSSGIQKEAKVPRRSRCRGRVRGLAQRSRAPRAGDDVAVSVSVSVKISVEIEIPRAGLRARRRGPAVLAYRIKSRPNWNKVMPRGS